MTNYIKNEAGLLVPFAPAILKRNYIEGGASHRHEMTGEYRMEVRRADGSLKHDTGWFKNLILNEGLNRLGTGEAGTGCAVGTGTSAPAATQTALQARSAWTTTNQSNVYSAQPTAPYFLTHARTYRFALGALNGNYSEVGVGWTQDNMFSRALIVDGGGNPSPITVLADEQLDVTYRLRLYFPTTDWGGTYTIGGASNTVTGRMVSVTSNWWSSYNSPLGNGPVVPVLGSPGAGAGYAGPLGAVTAGNPSGSFAGNSDSVNLLAYTNNSYSRSGTVGFGLNTGNAATFKVLTAVAGMLGQVQYDFAPAIAKDNTKTLLFTLSSSWARRP